MKKSIGLLALLLLPTVSFATDGNGIELLKACNAAVKANDSGKGKPEELIEAAHCLGLIRGHIGAGIFADSIAKKRGLPSTKLYCIPSSVSAGQTVRVVVKYLNKYPENLHYLDVDLVALALSKAYPCKQ